MKFEVTEKDKKYIQAYGRYLVNSTIFTWKYFTLFGGLALIFGAPLIYIYSSQAGSKQYAFFIFTIGCLLLAFYLLVFRYLAPKLSNYKPKHNKGDEWLK